MAQISLKITAQSCASYEELHIRLVGCQDQARSFVDLSQRCDEALHKALALSYVWYRACILSEGSIDQFLHSAGIKSKKCKRRFSPVVRMIFFADVFNNELEARVITHAINRYATALDAINKQFKLQEVAFGDEHIVVSYIRDFGGVEALIRKELGNDSNHKDVQEKKRNLGEQIITLAKPLASIPKNRHDLARKNDVASDYVVLLGRVNPSGDIEVLKYLRHGGITQSILTSIGDLASSDQEKMEADALTAKHNQERQSLEQSIVSSAKEANL